MREKICCPGRSSPFCLGMTDYNNCCGVSEPKYKKFSLSKKKLEKVKPLLVANRYRSDAFRYAQLKVSIGHYDLYRCNF